MRNQKTSALCYSFSCEYCGKNSGKLIAYLSEKQIQQMKDGIYPFPSNCPSCRKTQTWGTKAALKKGRWMRIVMLAAAICMFFIGMESGDSFAAVYYALIPLLLALAGPALTLLRDSKVKHRQVPQFVVPGEAAASKPNNGGATQTPSKPMRQTVIQEKNQVTSVWHCPACGNMNSGEYCLQCGRARGEQKQKQKQEQKREQEDTYVKYPDGSWKCPVCHTISKGSVCPACGQTKPEQ